MGVLSKKLKDGPHDVETHFCHSLMIINVRTIMDAKVTVTLQNQKKDCILVEN